MFFNPSVLRTPPLYFAEQNTGEVFGQELDNSCALKTSDAKELAEEFRLLHRDFPLKIYGGCCGTDDSHIREMIKVLQ